MKRPLLITLAILLTSVCAYASEGYYAGALGGFNYLQEEYGLHPDLGFAAGGFVGYKFYSGIRIEVEGTVRKNPLKGDVTLMVPDYGPLRTHITGHLKTASAMGNLLIEPFTSSTSSPYIGIGAGYTYLSEKLTAEGIEFRGYNHNFAWQMILGVFKPLFDDVGIGIEYRYFDPGLHQHNHSGLLSLRSYF